MSVNTPKRFLEKSEETVAKINDYVLIHNETLGTRKILVSNLKNHIAVNYNWYYNEDKTLVVREKISDGSFRWYFDNFHVTQSDYPFMPVPSNLQRFIMNSVTAYCTVDGYDNAGQIGFYEDVIRLWLYDLSLYVTGVVKGIIESTDTGNYNSHTWEEPTFDPYNG